MIFNKKKNNVPEDLPVKKGVDRAAGKTDTNYMAHADLDERKKAEEKLNEEYATTGVINPENFPKGVKPNTAVGNQPTGTSKKPAKPAKSESSELSSRALSSIKELIDFGKIKVDPRGRVLITGDKGGSFKVLFIPVDGRISVKTAFNDNWLVYDQNYDSEGYQAIADHISSRRDEVVEGIMNDTVKLAELAKKKEEIKKIEKKHSEAVNDLYGFDPSKLNFEARVNNKRVKYDLEGNYMTYEEKSGDLVEWGNILKEIGEEVEVVKEVEDHK